MAVVVASDAAAQSDIYSAVTLAGALSTDCLVLAGERSESMSSSQLARLNQATAGGYVVGGIAAVPESKLSGRTMIRIGGADRWATARAVGTEVARLVGAAAQAPTTIAGTGNSVEYVTLSEGRWTVTASVADNGGTNFIVGLFGPSGDSCELIANEIGDVASDVAVVKIDNDSFSDRCTSGEHAIEIDAEGEWTVTFERR